MTVMLNNDSGVRFGAKLSPYKEDDSVCRVYRFTGADQTFPGRALQCILVAKFNQYSLRIPSRTGAF